MDIHLGVKIGSFVEVSEGLQTSFYLEAHISPIYSQGRRLEPSEILEKACREHAGSVCLIFHSAVVVITQADTTSRHRPQGGGRPGGGKVTLITASLVRIHWVSVSQ